MGGVPAELTWLGQSGFLIAGEQGTVLVDAFLSDHPDRTHPAPVTAAELSFVDVVVCTHGHLDHLDLPTVVEVMAVASGARLIVPAPLVARVVAAGVAADRIEAAVPGTAIALPAATVHPVPAYHGDEMSDAYRFGPDEQTHPYLGYVFDLDGVRIFHPGDSLVYDGLAATLRALDVRIALLPINGRDAVREADNIVGNMDHREAALLAAAAGVHTVVPMHYEMFAANRGFPAHLVDVVGALDLDLDVLVPRLGRPFRLVVG